ncbi:MAG: hypothetical protein JSU65_10355, partial [Candidatus Zixiibacteriota bacterium]
TLSIADGGVTELKIATNAVTSAKLADDAVTAAKLADASVSSTEIIDGSVGTADLSPNCVTQGEILNGTILFEDIGQNGATVDQVIKWDGSGWSAADDEQGTGAGDITAVYSGTGLSGGGETGDVTLSIADGGVTELKIASNAVTTTKLTDDAVTAAKLADASVSSTAIVDGSIGTADLSLNCVTQGEILNGTILFEDIGQNGATLDQVIKWDGSGWSAADDEQGTGAGDITAVYSGTGLSGGGETGDVTLSIADGGVTELKIATDAVTTAKLADDAVGAPEISAGAVGASELATNSVYSDRIVDGTIMDADINAAAAITAAKISGTAATLNQVNNFNQMNYFHGGADFTDSVMRVSGLGVRLGDGVTPDGLSLAHLERDINQVSTRYSLYSWIKNSGVGQLIGLRSIAHHTTTGSGGTCYGVQSSAESDGSNRYGLWAAADAKDPDITTGYSYGVYGRAYDGNTAYGIYGYATSAITNWAGYFFGSVNVTGALYKGGGSFRIDHPLDPENKYLQHSFVESPDMMNVYNGNVDLDANGEAVIVMPDYFEELNRDFRYQLTAIGAPGPNLYVAEKISGNSFRIAGGEPFMEVSWQVTGVRKDAWAEANRIQVEVDKPDDERGLYVHPEAFGLGPEYSVDYEALKIAEEAAEARD